MFDQSFDKRMILCLSDKPKKRRKIQTLPTTIFWVLSKSGYLSRKSYQTETKLEDTSGLKILFD